MKNNLFNGIIPPMVMPLVDRDTLDLDGLEKLIEHILAGGIHGLSCLVLQMNRQLRVISCEMN